ncbi:Transcription elongation factor a protein 1, partial [Globisporangium splendens]
MVDLLPDFVFSTHSTKNDHRPMIEHWDKLFAQTKQPQPSSGGPTSSPMVVLFDNFYKYLFEMAPQVKPLFRSSMQVQGKALVRTISSIKNMLQSPDLLTFAADLEQRHVKYSIGLSHFNVLGITLMKTLKSCSEEMWTPETEMAWKRIYGYVAMIVVMELSKQTAAPRKSSLLTTLSSYRRQSGVDVTFHSPDDNRPPIENTKKSTCHHTPHPNAMCPMSGNRLKKMRTHRRIATNTNHPTLLPSRIATTTSRATASRVGPPGRLGSTTGLRNTPSTRHAWTSIKRHIIGHKFSNEHLQDHLYPVAHMLWRYMSASLIQTIWCAHLRRTDSDPIESTAEMAIMMTRLEAGMRNLTRLAEAQAGDSDGHTVAAVLKAYVDCFLSQTDAIPLTQSDTRGVYLLFFDGGSRGNPGPGGTGSVIVRVHKDSHTASLIWAASMAYSRKDTTNNFAEYWGLIHGLREAQRSHFEPLYVIGDSALIISNSECIGPLDSTDWHVYT